MFFEHYSLSSFLLTKKVADVLLLLQIFSVSALAALVGLTFYYLSYFHVRLLYREQTKTLSKAHRVPISGTEF